MFKRFAGLFGLAVLVLTLAAVPARAQDESPFRFGVKLGFNISDFRGDDGIEGWGEIMDWKLGFCGGLFMTYAVNERFAIQPEVLYTQKGMDIGLFGFSATWSLDYIEIPVLARFQIPVWGRAKPFVYAGPAIGFNVRSNIGASYEDEEIGSADLEDYTTSVDFSAAIGAGIYIPLAGQEISFEFRYVPGFSNVYTDDLEDQGVSIEQFNDTFSFLFGYEF